VDTRVRRAGVVITTVAAALAGCGSGGGAPKSTDPQAEDDWELVSGDKIVCGSPCSSASQNANVVYDFAFDGDDVLVTSMIEGIEEIFLFTPATATWVPVKSKFAVGRHQQVEITPAGYFFAGEAVGGVMRLDRNGAGRTLLTDPMVDTSAGMAFLRLSPDARPSLSALPIVESTSPPPNAPVLTELDPAAVGLPAETPMPGAWGDRYPYAFDEQGRLVYPTNPADHVASTLTFLDRATKATKVVTYASHTDADGDKFTAFFTGGGVWGPVPGGGVLAVQQQARSYDLVKLTDDGQVTTVVHLGGLTATFARLRLRDGHVYLGGYGLWRSKQKLF
jgi:hypothetical protein